VNVNDPLFRKYFLFRITGKQMVIASVNSVQNLDQKAHLKRKVIKMFLYWMKKRLRLQPLLIIHPFKQNIRI